MSGNKKATLLDTTQCPAEIGNFEPPWPSLRFNCRYTVDSHRFHDTEANSTAIIPLLAHVIAA